MKQQKRDPRGYVKTVAVCAILAVVGFVLDRFAGISIPLYGSISLMINISYVPILMAGILYGPIWGALVGGVQDILCMILVPLGAPIWGITATTMLAGAMAGVFGKFILKINTQNKEKPFATGHVFLKIIVFCAITAVTSSVLNSFWISITYTSVTFWVYLLPRLVTAVLVSTPLYTFLLYYLLVKAKWLKKMV